MKINVLLEGGVGDLVLATRFIAATREAYPDAYITAFINNENNVRFNDFIAKHWGYLVNEIVPNVERSSAKHVITSQFGQELYNSAFGNITPEWQARILDADKFYNFHLDSLKFTEYADIPWQKYFKHIPRPQNIELFERYKAMGDYVVLNLYARPDHFSALTQEQSDAIIRNVSDVTNVVIVAPSLEVKETVYKKYGDKVFVAGLSQSLGLISQAKLGVSIDTGLRTFFYPFGKTCFTLCKNVQKPFDVAPSHILRWYMWPEHMLPVDTNPNYITSLVEASLEKPVCQLFPQIPPTEIDRVTIHRRYA